MRNFTVIIPTCRRPDALARCLRALPADAEVIVSDDSPNPDPRWFAGPRRGPAANRNHGARTATSEWLAFIDDDCEPQPGWLAALAAASWDVDVVEGRTIAPGATDSPFEEHVENLTGGNFWSCNLAVRRSAFVELGGFDEDFREAAGEDMEFAWRIRQRGLRTVFAPEATVVHPVRRVSWIQLWRRTWMLRWMLLYRLKTGDAPPLNASVLRVAVALVIRETVELLRLTVHVFTRPDSRYPRSQRFHVMRRWLTFPLVLPWLLAWEFRFRRQLAVRPR